MSKRYKGGIISATPPTPSSSSASGEWTLTQQLQAQAAGGWPVPPSFYIEDLFSTYLYTGNGGTQTINNGINLAGRGGLVWIKQTVSPDSHQLRDTSRGGAWIASNLTITEQASSTTDGTITSYNSNGFTLGTAGGNQTPNGNNFKQVSWTFAKQPKFFDIVTYTGTGALRTIPHNLQSVPGCIMVKRTVGGASDWYVQHRSLGPTYDIFLNRTSAAVGSSNAWNSTSPTSTVFSLGYDSNVNLAGATYVAYLFAHDAGGFGASGSENIISCGSFTGSSTPSATTLGYEPQWILYKQSNGVAQWNLVDNIRGFTNISSQVAGTAYSQALFPNTSDAQSSRDDMGASATGFATQGNSAANTYIYIAIRRGPMKTPTVGTSVFAPVTYTGNGATQTITTNIVPSLTVIKDRNVARDNFWTDMLRGTTLQLRSNTTGAEAFDGTVTPNNTGFSLAANNGFNNSAETFVSWSFLRAPSFFDEACFTSTVTQNQRVRHNLTVAPDLIIVKSRNAANWWIAYVSTSALSTAGRSKWFIFSGAQAMQSQTNAWGTSDPTSTDFGIDTNFFSTGAGETDVAYLFATCAGVSKVGSYTGTAALLTVNCGFTTGARFVLIKRTDSTGDWYVWDSARGISSSNDPYLRWNSDAIEVTGTNYVDTTSVGFQVTAAAPAELNAVGGNYIFLAIA
jgi:hypothetical protein